MSTGSNDLTKAELTKKRQQKQIALVAVLSIGLVIALVTQPGTPPPVAPPVAVVAPSPKPMAVVAQTKVEPATSLVNQFSETRVLPRIDIETIQQQPLFSPATVQQSSVAVTQAVQAVYGSSAGHSALVDQGIIRSGATIRDGRTVMGVSPSGVHVSGLQP
ncbi:hypothetical protein K227x_50990 [Rubripirellula lacrimiformis]|uniref:Uncharacterized protein n=1 Tax=Rubripirellula lacrimiformis TaxID=1930273 RepID=A0A517NI00_9BACT|nr:hypothetical protein [Rubripirellula lacrimiformis]QDT06683.1 hypothetical protein K227x_50990 [Rubripirellula lacrimiformis]